VHRAQLAGGQKVTMKLAERGTRLSNDLWVREIRKLISATAKVIGPSEFCICSFDLFPRYRGGRCGRIAHATADWLNRPRDW